MIEADGYTSESDAYAYLKATYGYDADDTCDDASADEGNDLTVNAAASRQRQPPSGGILKKKKDLPRKSELLAADPRRFLANKATPERNKKDGKIIGHFTLHKVQVWGSLPIALTKFNLQYPAHTKAPMLLLLTQASSLTSS
jgi:hypothetical protein